jgi:branched-chain amino acid transport system ATP-binding protein
MSAVPLAGQVDPVAKDTLLVARDLVAAYGDMTALHGVSLEVRAGEVVAVLGSNGAGKSTLLKALAGLHPVRAGSVWLDGQRADGLGAPELVRRGVVYVPEGRALFPDLTVRENLWVGGMRRPQAERVRALEEVLSIFPRLGERLRQRVGTMSGGEQQMVALARALMAGPRLALIDEMSLGIAPVVVRRLFEVVRTMRERGVTVVLVEQNAHEALAIADRAYVLETGRVVLSGAAEELLHDPRVRVAYLGLGVH